MVEISPSSAVASLITGGNGYLGKYIVNHLTHLGWKVATLGRSPRNSYAYDLTTDQISFKEKFDVVIHCAGKAHSFPKTEREGKRFFDVNVKGTENLLKAIEATQRLPSSFVFISSVSVYGLINGVNIDEKTKLQSKHPYGASKALAEKLVIEWCAKHRVKYLIVRLPLLAGQFPPGNLGSMISMIRRGYYADFLGKVRKSIVLAEDVAAIIPKGIELGGIYHLTDGYHPSMEELSALIASQLGKPEPKTLPKWLSQVILGLVKGILSSENGIGYKLMKLTSTLTFDDSKARKDLGWRPKRVLDHFKIQ